MHSLEYWMDIALQEAVIAGQKQEVPVGAIIIANDEVVSKAHNLKESNHRATAHAEILAIESACQKLGRWRLSDCTLYVTMEPCLMCAGAIIQSRIGKVVFGCADLKAGAVASLYQTLGDSRLNHRPEVIGGVHEQVCSRLLKDFFSQLRGASKGPLEAPKSL